jgi:hypothetical protein
MHLPFPSPVCCIFQPGAIPPILFSTPFETVLGNLLLHVQFFHSSHRLFWSLLALTEFDGGIPSFLWNFTSSPFWIQIHDMPLICMTKSIGSKIGESLGILEAVDTEGEGVEWGSVLRIRVIIDIQKPLERGRSLTIAGKSHWVNFKYENLHKF